MDQAGNTRSASMIAKQYYKGWQKKDRSKICLHEDMYYTDGDEKYSSAEEFLSAKWASSGRRFENIQFICDGKIVCARYEVNDEQGKTRSYCEIVTVEEDKIATIEVFHGNQN